MIQFENVSKKYQSMSSEVVTDVNFTVPDGKIFVLIGPSGCGKTTCLKMINRLIRITSGRIRINGTDIMQTDPIELRRNMGYVIQQTGLFPHMTVRENIEIIPRLAKKDANLITERTGELMRMVGLEPDEYLERYPTQLSGGQLQRVGVARAFAMDPEIILMDEPFSALDPITRSQLQDELLFMQSKLKKTIVFVTHDMDEAVKLGNYICIINEGRVVQCDTPEEIMKHPADAYVADFVGRSRIWGNPRLIRVSDIMLTDPLVLPESLSLLRALGQMKQRHVTSALVTDGDHRYKGLVLASDIQNCPAVGEPLSIMIRTGGATVLPQTDLLELLALVKETKVSVLPVVDEEGILKGLITQSSLVTTLSSRYEDGETEGTA